MSARILTIARAGSYSAEFRAISRRQGARTTPSVTAGVAPNSDAGRAGPNTWPCASSQPNARSAANCSSVSTPSAIAHRAERVGQLDDRAADRVAVTIAPEIGDERLVDLDRVDRVVLQRHERRRAGAEVVDHEADADLVELPEREVGRLPVLEERVLGDLEPHVAGCDTALADDALHLRGQCRLRELARRDVHVELQRAAVARMPLGELTASLFEGPVADGDDRAAALGRADELRRGQEAALRVLPSDQRFEPRDPAGRAADDREIVEPELVARDRRGELAFRQR